ncbi:MAG: hypothetical protein WD075_04930 [Rhodospirillales bacterium]
MDTDIKSDATWDLLDHSIVKDLVDREGAARILGTMMSEPPSPEERIHTMCTLAVAGNIVTLRQETADFLAWAEINGMRRLVNTLIELNRVLALDARGQAIFQAQALTRFIAQNIDDDLNAFKRAVTSL